MIWIAVSFISIVAIINLFGYYISGPAYKGEKSDHFNGRTFVNQNGAKAKEFKDVFKWWAHRDQGEWNKVDSLKNYPEVKQRMENDALVVTYINHSTFLIQVGPYNILTDPIWSDRTSPVQFAGPRRMSPPGLNFDDLPPIDFVLISHNHYDHLDVKTVEMLEQRFSPQFYVPLGVSRFLHDLGIKNSTDMDWWDELKINTEVEIACVPAQHFSGRGMFDRDKTLWAGFVIKYKNKQLYFAGDSGYGSFFKKIGNKYGPFELSFIPIGAYKPGWFMSPIHISPGEAVDVHFDVRSKKSIAMHFGTFPLADDGRMAPVEDLNRALLNKNVNNHSFIVLANGDQYITTFSE